MPARPSILRTEAIVLRSMDYGETSRICTLFTLDRGKMSVIARGARSSKSRFGSTLDPMAHIQAIIYVKPSRALQSITDANHVRAHPDIREDLARIEVGLRTLELTNALLHDGQEHVELFSLLVELLTVLDEPHQRARNLVFYFQLRLASILGFAPSFDKAEVEALPETGGILDFRSGSISQTSDSVMGSRTASRSALRAFAILSRASVHKILRLALRADTEAEVGEIIRDYMRFHFEDSYPDRSSKVFAQLEAG